MGKPGLDKVQESGTSRKPENQARTTEDLGDDHFLDYAIYSTNPQFMK